MHSAKGGRRNLAQGLHRSRATAVIADSLSRAPRWAGRRRDHRSRRCGAGRDGPAAGACH